MSDVKTYNPKKVTVALGRHIASGFAEDSFITVEYSGDGTSHVVGCDGEVVRSIDPSDVYSVKLSVQQTSATNKFLQQMFDKDKKDGTGTFSINIKDILGAEQFTADTAWAVKSASWTRGKAQNNREWELVAANGEFR